MAKNDILDKDLVRKAAQGDTSSRDALISRYASLVAWHARRAAPCLHLYDDCFQEAQLGLVRAIETFNESSGVQFNTYATTCIINALRSFCRKYERAAPESLMSDDEYINSFVDTTKHNEGLNRVYVHEVRKALARTLSKREFDALFYRAEGYSYKEISSMLGVSEKSVANALNRAHVKIVMLRKKI